MWFNCSQLSILALFLLLPVTPAHANSQDSPDETTTLASFDVFLRHFDRMRSASATGSNGITAEHFFNQFRTNYEMDDLTVAAVSRVARDYSEKVAVMDARAAVLIKAAKDRYKVKSGERGPMVPPPPAELVELQASKDQATREAIGDLENSLGLAQLRYLRYQIGLRLIKKSAPATSK
jgi:hypothetical protein